MTANTATTWLARKNRNLVAMGFQPGDGWDGLTAVATRARAEQRCTRCLDSLDADSTGIEDRTHPTLCAECEQDWHGLHSQPMD